jgi:hypothetical protein
MLTKLIASGVFALAGLAFLTVAPRGGAESNTAGACCANCTCPPGACDCTDGECCNAACGAVAKAATVAKASCSCQPGACPCTPGSNCGCLADGNCANCKCGDDCRCTAGKRCTAGCKCDTQAAAKVAAKSTCTCAPGACPCTPGSNCGCLADGNCANCKCGDDCRCTAGKRCSDGCSCGSQHVKSCCSKPGRTG